MWRIKITIECSIGKRPDHNSVLYMITIDEPMLIESYAKKGKNDKLTFKIASLKYAFKEAKWWFGSDINHGLNCLEEHKGFRLVSIEEF